MANDKVEPWIDKMGDAVIAYVSERYDHAYGIYPLTLKELLAHHAAPVLAERDRYRDGLLDELARIDVLVVEQDAEIARLTEESKRLRKAVVENVPDGFIVGRIFDEKPPILEATDE